MRLSPAVLALCRLPFHQRRYHYFLHLVGGTKGISDLAGNPIDLQAVPVSGLEIADKLVMEARFNMGLAVFMGACEEDQVSGYSAPTFAARRCTRRPVKGLAG